MPAEKDSRTAPPPKRRAARHEPTPPVRTPKSVRIVAAIGIPISLAASAAVSFQGLSGLGALIGIAHPWLLPISIDVYAITATLIAMFLPEGHRARTAAEWNARLGLAMSMGGNAAERAIHLGSYTASDGILTFIGAWPSLIVERLLHLQGRLADSVKTTDTVTDTEAPAPTVTRPRKTDTPARVTVTDTPALPPSPTPVTDTLADTAPVTDTAPSPDTVTARPTLAPVTVVRAAVTDTDTDSEHAERSLPWWAEKAAPLYRQWMRDHNGTTPAAPMLADLLRKAGHDVPAGEVQRRKIRRETETYINAHPEPEPEPEQVGATS
jgi:hypothetical protein